jgi:hypothetical protein
MPETFASCDDDEEEPFEFLSADELLKQQMGREYLVDGILGWNESTYAWGPWKRGGKSTFWMWLAYRVSLGRPVFGRAIYQERPHSVLYLAGENPAITRDRVAALRAAEGYSPNFTTVIKPVDLLREDHASRLWDHIYYNETALTVVDPVIRAITAGTNDAQGSDVSRVMASVNRLKKETGSHIVLVGHSQRNSEDFRGHGDWAANADTLIRHRRLPDGSRSATVVEARGGEDGVTLRYGIRPIELQAEEHTRARTAAIMEELSDASRKWAGRPRSEYAAVALDRLHAAITAAQGGAVEVETWRASFYDAVPALTGENRRKQFDRARKELAAAGLVTLADNRASLGAGQN